MDTCQYAASFEIHVYIACFMTLLIQINEFVREAVKLAFA